ncbi:MAG: amidohydrolase family protein [Pelagibacteraceae bacterium]|nr:amidohydrolase family protein [Pelagibacteraceae bacterium]
MFNLNINDLDKKIWEEELNEFVPQKIYDVHTHIYQWKSNLDKDKNNGPYKYQGENYENVSYELLDQIDHQLFPGRNVERLSFPFPYNYPCDFNNSNDYVSTQTNNHKRSDNLILINPKMDKTEIINHLESSKAVGFKPYRTYSKTGDITNCKITDFLPEHQIAIANEKGLIIMMHLSKKDGVADDENINDLIFLSEKYPSTKWILAHCARSYSAWGIEKAAKKLRNLKNIWYDCSTVCESDALNALYTGVGVDRVMYGSDDMIGPMRGKYISFGMAWSNINEHNHSLKLDHCDHRMTFIRYEQLRAMKRGSRQIGLSEKQKKALFYDTAKNLVDSVKSRNKI